MVDQGEEESKQATEAGDSGSAVGASTLAAESRASRSDAAHERTGRSVERLPWQSLVARRRWDRADHRSRGLRERSVAGRQYGVRVRPGSSRSRRAKVARERLGSRRQRAWERISDRARECGWGSSDGARCRFQKRILGFSQQRPDKGECSTEGNRVHVLYDDDAIYVGAVMEHKHSPVVHLLARRDTFLESDWFGVLLDSKYDRRTALCFYGFR